MHPACEGLRSEPKQQQDNDDEREDKEFSWDYVYCPRGDDHGHNQGGHVLVAKKLASTVHLWCNGGEPVVQQHINAAEM